MYANSEQYTFHNNYEKRTLPNSEQLLFVNVSRVMEIARPSS
jgi:hypothetical protein